MVRGPCWGGREVELGFLSFCGQVASVRWKAPGAVVSSWSDSCTCPRSVSLAPAPEDAAQCSVLTTGAGSLIWHRHAASAGKQGSCSDSKRHTGTGQSRRVSRQRRSGRWPCYPLVGRPLSQLSGRGMGMPQATRLQEAETPVCHTAPAPAPPKGLTLRDPVPPAPQGHGLRWVREHPSSS